MITYTYTQYADIDTPLVVREVFFLSPPVSSRFQYKRHIVFYATGISALGCVGCRRKSLRLCFLSKRSSMSTRVVFAFSANNVRNECTHTDLTARTGDEECKRGVEKRGSRYMIVTRDRMCSRTHSCISFCTAF